MSAAKGQAHESRSVSSLGDAPKAPWAELLHGGRGRYTLIVVTGTMLHALQILVMVITMPTVIAELGGAAYYTWVSMLYTVGSIIGSAAVAPVWAVFGGARVGYALSGVAFLAGTIGCALAQDITTLNIARTVQGIAGGLVTGGGMALVGSLFAANLRTRVLALQQATFTVSQLIGPVIGGGFAQLGWWRGAFWFMVPILVAFSVLAWLYIPRHIGRDATRGAAPAFPFARLSLLSAGVFCLAAAGPVTHSTLRILLILGSVLLLWITFRVDAAAANKLYPSQAFSLRSPVGLSLWVLLLTGSVTTTVTLFMPLLLQVVHHLPPIFVSILNIIISISWSVGTFAVSGWSGRRERIAMRLGPLLLMAGLAAFALMARQPALVWMALVAFVYGIGQGMYYVHLLARGMAAAEKGEERITASALLAIRSVGAAFGAALAGLLASIAGLGSATEAGAVGATVTFIFGFNLLPLAIATVFVFLLLKTGRRSGSRSARADPAR